ncbi:hypothetical protein Mal15_32190 [Stieleria maiorica]|uniref:Uncharacterized protein n=1 Tax=Stieleria maiorica TaxID=2795974 RepID=A0A5B9MF60_9BACT|nr:hypothetical protein Mal15_32190 [Stieleria maiorica]
MASPPATRLVGGFSSSILWLNQALFLLRHSCVYLCIASLLIGNLAGWTHVGCVEANHACCQRIEVEATRPESPRHACCHHSHADGASHAHHSSSSCTTERTPEAHTDGSDHGCPDGHDSDRCSVCQSFFASRHAAFIVQPTALAPEISVQTSVHVRKTVRAVERLCRSISVRGPPRV